MNGDTLSPAGRFFTCWNMVLTILRDGKRTDNSLLPGLWVMFCQEILLMMMAMFVFRKQRKALSRGVDLEGCSLGVEFNSEGSKLMG